MDGEKHICRVRAHGVSDVTRVRPLVCVVQSSDLQDAGRGAGGDPPALVLSRQELVVLTPHDGRDGVTIECTADGCRGTREEVHVRGSHRELWNGCSEVYRAPSLKKIQRQEAG